MEQSVMVWFGSFSHYYELSPLCNITAMHNKLCGRPPQYAPTPASWPLTFWPWKWCLSHVWRGLPLCQF